MKSLSGGPPTGSGTPLRGGEPMARQALGRLWRRAGGGAGTWPLRALTPATGTAGTTETTGIAPTWRLALGIGLLGQRASCALHGPPMARARNGRDARCPSGFAQANGLARKLLLPLSRRSRRSRSAHQKMKSIRAARQLPAAIPAGGPPTPSGTPANLISGLFSDGKWGRIATL